MWGTRGQPQISLFSLNSQRKYSAGDKGSNENMWRPVNGNPWVPGTSGTYTLAISIFNHELSSCIPVHCMMALLEGNAPPCLNDQIKSYCDSATRINALFVSSKNKSNHVYFYFPIVACPACSTPPISPYPAWVPRTGGAGIVHHQNPIPQEPDRVSPPAPW